MIEVVLLSIEYKAIDLVCQVGAYHNMLWGEDYQYTMPERKPYKSHHVRKVLNPTLRKGDVKRNLKVFVQTPYGLNLAF